MPNASHALPRSLRTLGLVFLALGALAIALPAAATIAVEQLVALLLLVWGAAGIGLARALRPAQGWQAIAAIFALVLLLGLIFLFYPRAGISTLTMILAAVFLIEGVASIAYGWRLRDRMRNWGWMVFSGASALGLGLLITSGWPGTAAFTLGLLTGLNFLSTGLSLILLALAMTPADDK